MASSVSRIIWGIVLGVVLVLGMLAAVFGPDLVRKGRAVAGPILEMARAEDAGEQLDADFPFSPPEDGMLVPERLQSFLEIREALAPMYVQVAELEHAVESKGESWQTAAEVLDVVRDVVVAQNQLLRQHEMSLSEFRWMEQLVYGTWLEAVDRGGDGDPPWLVARLLELRRDDLERLDEAVRRQGASRAASEYRAYLESRVRELEQVTRPTVDDVAEANQEILWPMYDRVAALRLEDDTGLHSRLSSPSGHVQVQLGDDD